MVTYTEEQGLRPSDLQRFNAKIDKSDPDGCWPWTGTITRWGYGRWVVVPRGGYPLRRIYGPHRLALELAVGQLAPGKFALHKCNNRRCCRIDPAHVYEGSAKENTRDSINSGTFISGEKHPRVKLTDAQVAEVRSLYAAGGVTYPELAVRFGVSQPLIAGIVTGRRRLPG